MESKVVWAVKVIGVIWFVCWSFCRYGGWWGRWKIEVVTSVLVTGWEYGRGAVVWLQQQNGSSIADRW